MYKLNMYKKLMIKSIIDKRINQLYVQLIIEKHNIF